MFKFIVFFLLIQQVISIDEQVLSASENPLFTKVLELVDQLLAQVHQIQTLIIRTYNMFDQIPNDLRPFFAECFSATHNASRIEYSLNLSEAETVRIPQVKAQLNQATTLEQQVNLMNITEGVIADITYNLVKPSLLFVTEMLDCLKNKSQMTIPLTFSH